MTELSEPSDEACHFCKGRGEKWNPKTGNVWTCSPCQGTGLAKFYIEGAAKFVQRPECGIYMLWMAGQLTRTLEEEMEALRAEVSQWKAEKENKSLWTSVLNVFSRCWTGST